MVLAVMGIIILAIIVTNPIVWDLAASAVRDIREWSKRR